MLVSSTAPVPLTLADERVRSQKWQKRPPIGRLLNHIVGWQAASPPRRDQAPSLDHQICFSNDLAGRCGLPGKWAMGKICVRLIQAPGGWLRTPKRRRYLIMLQAIQTNISTPRAARLSWGACVPPNATARPSNTPGNTCIGAHTSADGILAT